jgi:PAS domain S-box-containing protein
MTNNNITESAGGGVEFDAAEYEALLNFTYQVPIGLVQIANDGTIEMINPMSVRLLIHVSRDGRLANLFDALQGVAPELRGMVAAFPAAAGNICREHRFTVEPGEPGRRDPQVLAVSLVRVSGSRLMAVITDVSVAAANERLLRESEAFSSRIIDSAPEAIIVVDGEGRMTRVNRQAEKTFGYSTDEMISQPVEMLVPERFRGRHADLRSAYVASPEALPQRSDSSARLVAGRRRDGSEIAVEAGLNRVEMNRQPHAVAVLRDVTERQEAQAALQRLNAELEQRVEDRTGELRRANREMEAFSYTVAHDLRAPIRAIDGFASMLRFDPDASAAERDDMLGKISAAAGRMAQQIDGLLALSQLSRTRLSLGTIDLSALAHQVSAELRQLEPGRAVAIEIEEGLSCEADPALMQCVLQNLMGNAWKYTSKMAAPLIRFGARRRDGLTEYFVADNGAGFDMQYATHMFEVFQRMHQQHEFPGIGIGLATVRRIMERHGGTISAESHPGTGATFYFNLG